MIKMQNSLFYQWEMPQIPSINNQKISKKSRTMLCHPYCFMKYISSRKSNIQWLNIWKIPKKWNHVNLKQSRSLRAKTRVVTFDTALLPISVLFCRWTGWQVNVYLFLIIVYKIKFCLIAVLRSKFIYYFLNSLKF